MNRLDPSPPHRRALKIITGLFALYLLFLLIAGFRGKVADQYVLQEEEILASETKPDQPKPREVIRHAGFDAQGFPAKADLAPGLTAADGTVIGHSAVLKQFQDRLGAIPPEQRLKDFAGQYSRYWADPQAPGFREKSLEMKNRLTATAGRNRRYVQSIVRFLESEAGKMASALLKENLIAAVNSPAREALGLGFSAWKTGDLDRAYQQLKQAEALDPHSSFIQIIAHHGMSVLNMEKHGPLEETMRQYRELAEEGHTYLSRFRPVLEKAGFDPVKLYGRDPFDASRLPSREQFEQAMEYSAYVKFEREYYRTHTRSPGRMLREMGDDSIAHLNRRHKGGKP